VTYSGECLCGGVRFHVDKFEPVFELCHCNRCRKVSGSAFAAMVKVKTEHYHLDAGIDLINEFQAPVLTSPPAYTVSFCCRCGSKLPTAVPNGDSIEIPAGLFTTLPIRPDTHICIEYRPSWHEITDSLPVFNRQQLAEHRQKEKQ